MHVFECICMFASGFSAWDGSSNVLNALYMLDRSVASGAKVQRWNTKLCYARIMLLALALSAWWMMSIIKPMHACMSMVKHAHALPGHL